MNILSKPIGLTLLAMLSVIAELRADTVQLINGETLKGTVLLVDLQHVQLKSEILGDLTLDRTKVAAIIFVKRYKTSHAAIGAIAPGIGLPAVPAREPFAEWMNAAGVQSTLTPESAANAERDAQSKENSKAEESASVEDVIRRMQANGVNPEMMRELERSYPVLASPDVKGYVNQTLNGLAHGDIDVEDLRRQANRARLELMNIKAALGSSGGALDGYLGILNQFLRETEGFVQDDK